MRHFFFRSPIDKWKTTRSIKPEMELYSKTPLGFLHNINNFSILCNSSYRGSLNKHSLAVRILGQKNRSCCCAFVNIFLKRRSRPSVASKVTDVAQGHKNINSYKTGRPTGKNVYQLLRPLYTIPNKNTRDESPCHLYFNGDWTSPESGRE